MRLHLQILSWLYIVLGVVSLVFSGWFAYVIFADAPDTFAADVKEILIAAGYGTALLALLVFASVGTLLTGLALLWEYRYARLIAKAFAVIGLIDFPFGTMLGAYALWVLSHTDGRKMA